MSSTFNPLRNSFELQRSTLKQSRDAFEQFANFQRDVGEAMIVGTEATSEMGVQGIETSRQAIHGYLDVIEATMPGSDETVTNLQETLDSQFDQLEEQQKELFTIAEDGIEDATDIPVEYIDTIDEQLDSLLEVHEETQKRTIDALAEIEARVDEMQDEGEMQAEEIQERVQEMQSRISQDEKDDQPRVMDVEPQDETVDEKPEDSLELIDGLGPTYADRLHDEGIDSLQELSQTKASTITESVDISEERATKWINAAQSKA